MSFRPKVQQRERVNASCVGAERFEQELKGIASWLTKITDLHQSTYFMN